MDIRRSAAVQVGDAEVGVNVDIDLQQVEESRVHDGPNNTEMNDHARRVMDERREQRKKATAKGYGVLTISGQRVVFLPWIHHIHDPPKTGMVRKLRL